METVERAKRAGWGAGITPASGFIDSQASLALGALIGLSTFGGVRLIKHGRGVDDALDVSSVHGVSGVVGSVMVGVLATKSADPTIARNGLAYGGGADQLLAQLLGVGVAALYSAVLTALILASPNRDFDRKNPQDLGSIFPSSTRQIPDERVPCLLLDRSSCDARSVRAAGCA